MFKIEKKSYVEYYNQKDFDNPFQVLQVNSRDIANINIPKGVTWIKFFDRNEIEATEEVFKGKADNFSEDIIIANEIFDAQNLHKLKALNNVDPSILLRNMKQAGYDKVAQSRTGEYTILNRNRLVLTTLGKQIHP